MNLLIMRVMKKLLYLFLLVGIAQTVSAQTTPVAKKAKTPPQDGFNVAASMDSAVMVPFPAVRLEDVYYRKRVWQEIDLRDTINSIFRAPKSRLMDVFLESIQAGELSAYAPNDSLLNEDDEFRTLLAPDTAVSLALGSANIEKNGVVTSHLNKYPQDYDPNQFMKFRIKEDWILDVRRSVFEPRIVGIAPLKFNEDSKTWQPVFWIYFTEAREILARKKAINANNDATPLSFDDIFIRRLFASNIIKESSPGDMKIKDLIADPKQRLYESMRIKKAISDYEQGLWQY